MPLFTLSCWLNNTTHNFSRKLTLLYDFHKVKDNRFCTKAFARQKSVKKLRRNGQSPNGMVLKTTQKSSVADESKVLSDGSSLEDNDVKVMQNSVNFPSRSDVLQACTVTSGLIAALGIVIRQVSHVASVEGLPILDCSTEVSFGIEMWHLELIIGLVIVISSCRYLLLKTWPDFVESTEAANQQGNLRWASIWLCYHCIFKHHSTNGFSCIEQFGWRDLVAHHIKFVKVFKVDVRLLLST